MAHRFRDDYVTLGLDDNADWASAQIQYRRQVNRWHPDRFVQRPRERLHAEQRFIQLTKAFERIRAFYRINLRLPFEAINRDSSVKETRAGLGKSGDGKAGARSPDIEKPQFRKRFFDDSEEQHYRGQESSFPSGKRLLLWLVPGVMVAATGVVFVVLDRNAQRASLEEARRHLIEQAPSEFQPSASEVNNRNRRGAFVEDGNSGKMGDMLMPDVFR